MPGSQALMSSCIEALSAASVTLVPEPAGAAAAQAWNAACALCSDAGSTRM